MDKSVSFFLEGIYVYVHVFSWINIRFPYVDEERRERLMWYEIYIQNALFFECVDTANYINTCTYRL